YYRYCNHRYLHFFGRTAEATIGKHLRDVYGEEMFTSTVAPDLAWVMQGQEVAFTRTLKSGGDIRHLEGKYIPQIDASGQVNGFFKAAWDVTEQYEREQQLSREVSTDALTGTLNRRAILAAIQGLPLRFSHGSTGAALLYLDVDHFKQINDTFG